MRKTFLSTRVLRAVVLAVGGVTVLVGSALPVEQSGTFTFELGVNSLPGKEKMKTFDVLSGEQQPWLIQYTVTGNVNTLVFSIRDSSPGDFCWYYQIKRPKGTGFVTQQIAKATVNACGLQYPDDDAALVFLGAFQGGKDGGVTVTVTYPPLP